MRGLFTSIVFFYWLMGQIQVYAQTPPTTTLTGRVTDVTTGKEMPFANVFINNTTRGTSTDENGQYRLTQVPIGTVEVVASFVGYAPTRQFIRLGTDPSYTINIQLKTDDSMLKGVTITAKRSKAWERQFRRFRDALLGDSPFMNQCLIPNSQSVQLTDEDGHLRAKATEPLIIENRALGYRLLYDMIYFDLYQQVTFYAGACRFEEMKPENPDQAERWQRNRQQAYTGSTRHLLASMIAGTYEREGFLIYKSSMNVPSLSSAPVLANDFRYLSKPIKADSLFKPGELSFERLFATANPLEIFYTKRFSRTSPYRDMPYAYSLLTLPQGSCLVTTDGWVSRPQGMEIRGFLGNDRLANMLPADWRPVVKGAALAAQAPREGIVLKADRRLDSLARWWQQAHRRQTSASFLHTDKALYATGDRVWLSAYLLDATSHQLTPNQYNDLDNALHVALINSAGRVAHHQWIRITDGRGSGDFQLSDTLQAGLYRLVAYSEAERLDSLPTFDRPVAIYNLFPSQSPTAGTAPRPQNTSQSASNSNHTASPDSISLQVLPEGGRWVVNLPARLGLKAVGGNGKGQLISGRIVDDQGKEVVPLVTNALGMGHVEFTPEPSRFYVAEWKTTTGVQRINIREPDVQGLVMHADAISDTTSLTLRIRGSDNYANQAVYVTVQSRGQLLQQSKIQLEKGKATIELLTARLPTGLCQINIFDANGRPWAERLVFIPERLAPLALTIIPDKDRYQPQQPARLGLTLTDGSGFPVVAQLSASITDADQLPPDTMAADIRTHLLLTGDLRGKVENPAFYLRDTSPQTQRALDDLLLTQGWRRLNWRQPPVQISEASDTLGGVVISGRVFDRKGKPVPNAEVLLTSLTPDRPFTRSVGADNQGYFRLGGLMLTDTTRLMGQALDYKLQAIKATVVLYESTRSMPIKLASRTDTVRGTSTIDWSPLSWAIRAARLRQESSPQFYRQRNTRMLTEVVVKAEKPRDVQLSRSSIHGMPDATIIVDDKMPTYNNVYELMMGRVAGVQVSRQPRSLNGYSVVIRGVGSLTGSVQPLYLVDGVYMQENDEGNALLVLDPSNIDRIEVLKGGGAAIYGSRGGNGVIAFYTKKFKPKPINPADRVANEITVVGFPTQREFYVPAVSESPDQKGPIDRRDVLVWKPNLQTDAQGQATISFPLSDVVRTIRVNVQGITTYGRPISAERLIRVQ